jgi:hypothetical protein
MKVTVRLYVSVVHIQKYVVPPVAYFARETLSFKAKYTDKRYMKRECKGECLHHRGRLH